MAALAPGASSAVPLPIRHVFVTSVSGPGDLSSWSLPGHAGLVLPDGIAAGDVICQTLAGDAGLSNAAGYVAWLSDGSDDAFCRVLGLGGARGGDCGQASPPSLGGTGRNRLASTLFSTSLARLAATGGVLPTEPLQPARFDENGTPLVAHERYWTGTDSDGIDSGADCGGWTTTAAQGTAGSATGTLIAWTRQANPSCSSQLHLLCFEKGTGGAAALPIRGGRRAFVTSVAGSGVLHQWADAGGATGLDAGDAICRARAAAGGLALASTFKAWLSTSTVDARTRFTDGPWVRMDGILVATGLAELDLGLLETAIDRNEKGAPAGLASAWTGTGADGTLDPGGQTCADWTDGTAAQPGLSGEATETSTKWTFGTATTCEQSHHLYCLSDASPALLFADGFDSGTTRLWSGLGQ